DDLRVGMVVDHAEKVAHVEMVEIDSSNAGAGVHESKVVQRPPRHESKVLKMDNSRSPHIDGTGKSKETLYSAGHLRPFRNAHTPILSPHPGDLRLRTRGP